MKGQVLSLAIEGSGLVAPAFVIEAFGIAGSDFTENQAERQISVISLIHRAKAAGHKAKKKDG